MNKAESILRANFPNFSEKQSHPMRNEKSTLVLGVHKGGSTMLHSFIQVYSELLSKRNHEFSATNLSRMLFQGGVTDDDFDDVSILPQIILSKTTTCFYGWRQIPMSFLRYKRNLSALKSICLIRDPRDCVVSAYYSFLKTHRLPKDPNSKAAQEIISLRQEWADKSIDDYALANIGRFTQELSRVAAFSHPLLRIYRYEDIWFHKSWFFEDVIRYLDLPSIGEAFQIAYERVDIKPGSDKSGHVRKGLPGDHVEKLSPATIAKINSDCKDLLTVFDYAI